MIDYTKIYLLNIDINKLLNSSKLDFKCDLSKSTGDIAENRMVASYMFCKIEIKRTKEPTSKTHVIFSGSIHKMWNELKGINAPNYKSTKIYKGYNGNQFTINDVIEVRNHLENLFECNSNQMIFQNIEFGVNTSLNYNPVNYLKGLLYHRNKLFEYRHSGNYAQVIHQFFYLKIYNKSFQYQMPENTLRVEIKVIKMKELINTGIKTFYDINQDSLKNALDLLLKRFDEVMYYDNTISKEKLSNQTILSLSNYSNPRYWIETLKPIHRDRHKKKLKEITVKYSQQTHQKIYDSVFQKCVINNQLSIKTTCVTNNTSNIELKTTHKSTLNQNLKKEKRFCKLTGVDISNQRLDSELISHTGLKQLYKNDIHQFNIIKNKYLSKKWVKSSFEIQIREIAHNIRNTKSNQIIKRVKIYPQNQYNLIQFLID